MAHGLPEKRQLGEALMGTSTSSKGSGRNTPLVPPWADIDGQGPGPEPEAGRFRQFRAQLGRFASGTGSDDSLHRALGHYARATGGSRVGPRRFGAMAQAGGDLFETLSALRDGQEVTRNGVTLSALDGMDTQAAIDAIVAALTPENGDSDRIMIAMREALSQCLEGLDDFDFASITDEMLVNLMLRYVQNCVFTAIVLESNEAFSKAPTATVAEQREAELRDLVAAVVDVEMQPLLNDDLRGITAADMTAVQLRAIGEVWAAWENREQ